MRIRLYHPWSLETFDHGFFSERRFFVYLPDHPRASKQGYIRRSIVAYEAYHDVEVPPEMIVHHIDENKMNDSKENLKLMTRGGHRTYHNLGEKNHQWKGDLASPTSKYSRAREAKVRAIAEGRLTPEIEAEYERALIEQRPHRAEYERGRRARLKAQC